MARSDFPHFPQNSKSFSWERVSFLGLRFIACVSSPLLSFAYLPKSFRATAKKTTSSKTIYQPAT